MSRISLLIYRGAHPVAAQIGYTFSATRIVARVALKTPSGWTSYEPGIVDTGATVSLFPARTWRAADCQIIGDVQVGGVIPLDQCRIRAKLARVSCALSDGTTLIGPFNIHAYLAESDEVPLLLGVSDLIESGTLLVSMAKNQATFEC